MSETQLNRRDDGRGLRFDDPKGHLSEIRTRSYRRGGLGAGAAPGNPLLRG